jgi:hypothetical protein
MCKVYYFYDFLTRIKTYIILIPIDMDKKNYTRDFLQTIPFHQEPTPTDNLPQVNFVYKPMDLGDLVNEEEGNKTVLTIRTGSKDWILLLLIIAIGLVCLIALAIIGVLILQEIQLLKNRVNSNF